MSTGYARRAPRIMCLRSRWHMMRDLSTGMVPLCTIRIASPITVSNMGDASLIVAREMALTVHQATDLLACRLVV
ncbi:MAG: hypothetical protein COC14_06220 [Burkholderiaceae bacterium]|nr:hypothetical protein C3Z06_12955 [Cupriavidus metallidurans]KWR71778.1 hypothetical protein RN01_31460 [Cupriavidus sp. SHE]PCH56877.1 MAG: hypothetical protein COC14_06220 [Burkholderiaceae bacterium]